MSVKRHAELGPSSASRWIHCPASVRLSRGIEETPTAFAAEGTLAHLYAEKSCAKVYGRTEPLVPATTTEEMLRCAEGWAMLLAGAFPPDTTDGWPELQVDASLLVGEECWGTADFAGVAVGSSGGDGIADFKYGKGIKIDAVGNPQLQLYAAAMWSTLGLDLIGWSRSREVRLIIFQPRVKFTPTTWTTDWDSILGWVEEVVKPAAKKAMSNDPGEPVPGPWCRFCRAKGLCPARAKEAGETLAQFWHKVNKR